MYSKFHHKKVIFSFFETSPFSFLYTTLQFISTFFSIFAVASYSFLHHPSTYVNANSIEMTVRITPCMKEKELLVSIYIIHRHFIPSSSILNYFLSREKKRKEESSNTVLLFQLPNILDTGTII